MSQEIDGIYIRESLDGRPIETKSEQKKTKKATKKRSEDVVTALKSDPYIWGIYLLLVLISFIELYSASASEVVGTNVYAPLIRHGMFLGIGLVIRYLIQRIQF